MTEELHDPRTGFHDLKPLVPDSESDQWVYLLLFVIIALFVIWFFRRKPVIQVLPPRDIAAAIAILRDEVSGGKKPITLAASELSQRLREWIEQSHGISAVELTRLELEQALAQGFSAEYRSRIIELVSRCERIAFDGSDRSTADDIRSLADSVLGIVKEGR